MDDYLALNRSNWDARADVHVGPGGYRVDLIEDPSWISQVVRFDQPLLDDLTGVRGVHLQCHIGTDTLSLARLGATMTGVDLSPRSLHHARAIAERGRADITYVESDVYAAPDALGGATFDLVYTGIGALCWLPDIERWARTVAALLKPGGRLFLRDGHPMLMAVNEDHQDRLQLDYPYFEREAPTVRHSDQTYVDTDQALAQTETHEWSHGLGEVISALLGNGLRLTALEEHQSIPWEALPGQMVKGEDGEYRLREQPARLPLSYTLVAVKA